MQDPPEVAAGSGHHASGLILVDTIQNEGSEHSPAEAGR